MRDEAYRVAERLGLKVFVVSNGSRPIIPSRHPDVRMVMLGRPGRSGRLDRRAHRQRRRVRDLGHPAGRALPGQGSAGSRARRQDLDARPHRQCAGRARGLPTSAGTGDDHRRSGALHEGAQVALPRRSRQGRAGGTGAQVTHAGILSGRASWAVGFAPAPTPPLRFDNPRMDLPEWPVAAACCVL